jgi:anti-anti-sigma regulatory factor
VIDTDGLDFMGCCAFTALAEEADRCRRRGIRMCVVSRKPIVGRIIAAGALSLRLPVYPDVDTALSAAAADRDCPIPHDIETAANATTTVRQ